MAMVERAALETKAAETQGCVENEAGENLDPAVHGGGGSEVKANSNSLVKQGRQQKRKRSPFIYGNYDRYYGYRIGKCVDEDPRLKLMQREWFEGKDCLDIGCNEGYVTITIAQKYRCTSILGVDIDPSLIGRARRHLKNEVESTEEQTNGGFQGEDLAQAVHFRTENFLETPIHNGIYDTVLCLSVTKWIHLNWGDKGLIRFFSKIIRVLRPGGTLLLEPQPWKSYSSKKNISEVGKKNFNEIKLRPDTFPELLVDKIGFKSMQKLTSAVPNSTQGFGRPLFAYFK